MKRYLKNVFYKLELIFRKPKRSMGKPAQYNVNIYLV